MIYVLLGAVSSLYAALVIGFWCDVRRFGKWKETIAIGVEINMLAMDGVSVYLAFMVFYFAAHDWFGFTVSLFHEGRLMSWQATLLAAACAITSVSIGYFNGLDRFTTPTHAGRREATLRFLASRQIIQAAEVAHALEALHQHEARLGSSRVIDAGTQEVGK
ncbi:hypothetical protein [Burkholderia multivorans]|uniref:hypothetical protein n=1 Tax=Burkholderia multivorans TaxID=87883 RepID=UPI00209D2936|nr:hypothetical protein [Burkholderia multivorans]MCO8590378.1 hypothetical protein [Burkholderia multivorans]MCO8632653.1 hypothetical protein [Burkholderia multivorans]MCO8647210.1 hypothetical protein [Burkholderia multivorans]